MEIVFRFISSLLHKIDAIFSRFLLISICVCFLSLYLYTARADSSPRDERVAFADNYGVSARLVFPRALSQDETDTRNAEGFSVTAYLAFARQYSPDNRQRTR